MKELVSSVVELRESGTANDHEIGFSDNTDNPRYAVKDEKAKLTIEEMNAYDMHEHVAQVFEQRREL